MTRDKHRDEKHFQDLITAKTKSHETRISKLESGLIKPERVEVVKKTMVTNLVQKLVATYSAGLPIGSLKDDFEIILSLIEDSWAGGVVKFVGKNNTVLDQYSIDPHTQLLRILSIGFLIGLPNHFFQRLREIINSDNVVDTVFEFILSSRLEVKEMKPESESYQFKLYSNLKRAIGASGKPEAESFIKVFLDKDWLREQKKAQMLTGPDKDWYYGRWSFESAAVVAIKDLDDNSFRDNPYYPKDLVDYYRENVK